MRIALQFGHRGVADLVSRGLRSLDHVGSVQLLPSDSGFRGAVRDSRARVFVLDGVTASTSLLVDRLRLVAQAHPGAPVLVLARNDRELLHAAVQNGATGVVDADTDAATIGKALEQLAAGHFWLSSALVSDLLGGRRSNDSGSAVDRLSPRQRQVFELLGSGYSTQQIAELLGVGAKTVETHRLRLMQALGLKRAHELVALAARSQVGLSNQTLHADD